MFSRVWGYKRRSDIEEVDILEFRMYVLLLSTCFDPSIVMSGGLNSFYIQELGFMYGVVLSARGGLDVHMIK